MLKKSLISILCLKRMSLFLCMKNRYHSKFRQNNYFVNHVIFLCDIPKSMGFFCDRSNVPKNKELRSVNFPLRPLLQHNVIKCSISEDDIFSLDSPRHAIFLVTSTTFYFFFFTWNGPSTYVRDVFLSSR